jgi:hypothetical protein
MVKKGAVMKASQSSYGLQFIHQIKVVRGGKKRLEILPFLCLVLTQLHNLKDLSLLPSITSPLLKRVIYDHKQVALANPVYEVTTPSPQASKP